MNPDLSDLRRWAVFAQAVGINDQPGDSEYEYFRVVGIDRDINSRAVTSVAVLNETKRDPYPIVYAVEDFSHKLESRQWLCCNFNPFRPRVRDWNQVDPKFRPEREKERDARLKLVQFIDRRGFEIFYPDSRGKAIAEVCEGKADGKTHGESWIRQLLWNWWYYGGDSFAFIPNYSACGTPSRESIIENAAKSKTRPKFNRRYRKPAPPGATPTQGCEIGPEMYDKIVDTIKDLLENDDKRAGIANAVRRTKGLPWTLFRDEIHKVLQKELGDSVTIVDRKPVKTLRSIDQLPNRDQIRYIGRKVLKIPVVLRKIKGSRVFNLENRGLTGDSSDIATQAGQVYEVDAFELDVHGVHDITLLPIGRLYIYFVVDVYSTAIAGVYVTCGEPDYRQVAMALHVAFMPKSQWGKIIGMDISDKQWMMQGKADSLLGDGGELAHLASNVLPEMAVTDLANTPPCRGDLKAQVEQSGELADIGTIRFLPGATKGPKMRMAPDPAKKAKISTLKITQRITSWAFEVYNIRNLSAVRIASLRMLPELVVASRGMLPWAPHK